MKIKKFNFNQFKYFLYLFLLGFILFFLAKTPVLKSVTGGLERVSTPLQIAFYEGFKDMGDTFSTVANIGSLRRENGVLKMENAKLAAANARLQAFATENISLRAQLGVKSDSMKIVAAAHPVGKGAFGSKSVLELDKGESDGVKQGAWVVVENMLFGKVIALSAHLSSVQLLSDPVTKIPALTSGSAEGLLVGQFGSEVDLTEVVQEDTLKEGDLVYTSGKDSYPKGLVLGKIVSVNKVDKELFQKAVVAPLVDVASLELVYLVNPT